MSYLLDGALPAYPCWRNYFDVIVVSGAKPEFFTEEHPFVELDPSGEPLSQDRQRTVPARARLRGRQPHDVRGARPGPRRRRAASSATTSTATCCGRASRPNWRTAMVLQELEHEVEVHDRLTPDLLRLDHLERQLRHLDAEINDKQMVLRSLQRRSWRRNGAVRCPRQPARRRGPRGGQAHGQGDHRAAAQRAAFEHAGARPARGRRSTTPSTRTGARCSARATRSASSASRSRPTPASTPAASRTSASTPRCRTSAAPATACPTNVE